MEAKIDQSLMLPDRAQLRETGNTNLGKDDFLKILIAQLANQDPLNPMEDREFISQMASFSSLEQMVNMNESLQSWVSHQNNGQLLQYSQLIGKEITWVEKSAKDREPVETTKTGEVAKVHFEKGETKIELTDGTRVHPSQIITLSA
ncbi:flagellar hook assembly protein FlgD [Pseudalkalibacillus salsuginis]|uniref:flagellar hook assembly protein FlgD n=1 Tax=Pseudalkalibacillus salsuginis TaxID=2910972 RepID=UPI001F15D1C5|nr:flagellar hook assembly protein FlgD [Pseudalkalibacillus salsuginis]MCF6410571.1 flagellar hook assembly protein FlgD [Pseudalkalibacillus salsuginis]